jgi:hypothetical protein
VALAPSYARNSSPTELDLVAKKCSCQAPWFGTHLKFHPLEPPQKIWKTWRYGIEWDGSVPLTSSLGIDLFKHRGPYDKEGRYHRENLGHGYSMAEDLVSRAMTNLRYFFGGEVSTCPICGKTWKSSSIQSAFPNVCIYTTNLGGMIIHRCRYEKAPLAMAISISRPMGVEKLVQQIWAYFYWEKNAAIAETASQASIFWQKNM